jgi:hypothetical protein
MRGSATVLSDDESVIMPASAPLGMDFKLTIRATSSGLKPSKLRRSIWSVQPPRPWLVTGCPVEAPSVNPWEAGIVTSGSGLHSPGSNRNGCGHTLGSIWPRVGLTVLDTIRSPRSSGGWTMLMKPTW